MLKIAILGILFFFNAHLYALDSTDSTNLLRDFEQEYSIQEPNDPLYDYNHFMHTLNWGFYDYALNPLLNTYNKAIPLGYRLGIYNFFDNLTSPLRFLAHLFAFEPKRAIDELGRFMLNSSVGILGLFDVASQNQLYTYKIDFGITFGKWGIGSGAYLALPILGPSSVRDTIALPLNALANPTTYLNPTSLSLASSALKEFNYIAYNKDTIDTLRKDALGDDYILLRNAYLQHRDELIKGNL
ncbi:MlaA family lipoprotein [Helicobacter turcicus]|uniref:VacJ family lipoprotein n=1 Tax=Helicobacter turcicus TaxID=2867412 RepID=A0ABS7JNF1_9HELI|nr:VacJ family lipoprotein [Helicobacter turcicus]MBX7490927.1 VacJ family lipoprotein [Helicobacter turcicus]MBX7545781.1 VacJ family lipoprotein [Helicobacter turcicus]